MGKKRFRPFDLEKAQIEILRMLYGENFMEETPPSDNALIFDLHDHLQKIHSENRALRARQGHETDRH